MQRCTTAGLKFTRSDTAALRCSSITGNSWLVCRPAEAAAWKILQRERENPTATISSETRSVALTNHSGSLLLPTSYPPPLVVYMALFTCCSSCSGWLQCTRGQSNSTSKRLTGSLVGYHVEYLVMLWFKLVYGVMQYIVVLANSWHFFCLRICFCI